MIWNKKKQNLLLLSEIFLSFLVMYAVFTMLAWYYRNYKTPMGLEYEHLWVVNYSNGLKTQNTDSVNQYYEVLKQLLKGMPEVREISFTNVNVPFSQVTNSSMLHYNHVAIGHVNWYQVDEQYKDVLQMEMLQGRWFEKQDVAGKDWPVILNQGLAEKIFGKGPAVGKFVFDGNDKTKRRVIGVVKDVKMRGDYAAAQIGAYNLLDTGAFRWLNRILVRVSPDASAAFEGRLYKTLANYMKNGNVEIEHMTNKRKAMNYFNLVPIIVLLIVAAFLIINVALGLFGVLWYNINKRRGEIGLRRAIGATGRSVAGQLVSESMILATFSLLIGLFFAVQFPLLHVFDLPTGVYVTGIVGSVLFIYILVLICSLYPGRQAAAIYPAVALHED